MKKLFLVVIIALVAPNLYASSFGQGFQVLFKNDNMHFLMNKKTDEKLVITKSELAVPFEDVEKFYTTREFQNDVALPFGFISKSVQTDKKRTERSLEMQFNVYSYSPYTGSEVVSYQKISVQGDQLITMDYYPGKTYNSAKGIFDTVPKNLFSFRKSSKYSLLAELFAPAYAAENCETKSAGLTNQITSILEAVKIDCTKPEFQTHGTLTDIRNVLKGCVAGFAIGGLETIKFVVDAFDFLLKMAQDDSYRQELKSSLGQVSLLTQVDPRAAAMAAMKMAVTGLKEAAGNFRSCGLQYQAQQACQVVAMLIPPGAIAGAVFRKVAAKSATKVAAKKAAEKAAERELKSQATHLQMQHVFTETTEATQEEWDEAVKLFKAAEKNKAEKAAAEAAAKEARLKAFNDAKNQQHNLETQYHDADSDLAKEYASYFAEQKQKAKQAAEALAAKRVEEAAAREAKKKADLIARANGYVPGKSVQPPPSQQIQRDKAATEVYIRQLREENAKLLKDLGLDK